MAVMATKPTKKVSTEKKVSSHPPYAEMIKEAIAALKERTGSSQIAIAKFISDKHKSESLGPNYKRLILSQLKRLVASGSLVKVKHSFKLASKPAPAKPKTVKKAPAAKPKKVKIGTPVKAKKAPAKPKAKKATPAKVKKATPAAMKAKKVVMKAKNVVKKPKSIKSPVKKTVAVKKAKK